MRNNDLAAQTPIQQHPGQPRSPGMPLFTIFTPTYNRAHTLHRVFDSLCAQTLRDFEWLIVDDGSTDDTDKLVGEWMERADFPVRYLRQNHLGKHIAHNRAVREARGVFFGPLDSDDALLSDALEKIAYHWNTIPEAERHAFSGIDGLCCDVSGKIIGKRFPASPLDTTLRHQKYIYRTTGEKWGVARTDILVRYPFPEIALGEFLPEGIVWLEIAKAFKSRAVNEVVRVYYVDDASPGLTRDKKQKLGAHALGRWHFYIWLLNNDLEFFFRWPVPFLKAAVMLPIVARISGNGMPNTLRSLKSVAAQALVIATLPLSALICLFDRVLGAGA